MHAAPADPVRQEYSYYAFISYSRKDIKWARWLQHRLETYRLPAKTRKEHSHVPARIVPVFRDETDLSGGVLLESLQKELKASQYLIVICSPESAASGWVDMEISYFASLGREKNIIPFVVAGEPNAQDPALECFPAALREMEAELLGISVPELGKRPAFLRVVSTLLQLKYDQVVQRDRARRVRSGTLLGTAAAIAVAALSWIAWYNMPHSKYYNSFVYQNEVPVGIYEMSEQERSAASDSYRITTQRGKVIRVECVNYLGVTEGATVAMLSYEYPDMEFQYDDAGRLLSVELSDATGMVVSRKVLTYNDATRQIAIDFRQPSNNLQVQALSSDVSIRATSNTDIGSKSEITRQVGTYDENGRLVTVMFQRDNLGNPACDSNGVYGKRYEYDELGQVIRVSNLNEDGEIHNCKYGWAILEMTYDEMGNMLTEQYYNTEHAPAKNDEKCAAYLYTYDEHGNLLQIESFNEQEERCNNNDGYSIQAITFDKNGLMTGTKFYNAREDPAFDDGIHEVRYQHDANGRICHAAFYGSDGQPIYYSEGRYSSIARKWDDAGRLLEEWVYDAQGYPIPGAADGSCGIRCTYDENGYVYKQEYLDAHGDPFTNKYGYAVEIFTTDDAGRLTGIEYWDELGNLTKRDDNFAVIKYDYDTFGNITGIRYFDESGEPCYSTDGYAAVTYTYENGNMVSEKFFDADGQPMLNTSDYYHECRMDYDDKGNRIRWSYYDTNGNLVNLHDNYAVIENRYDEYGNVTAKSYYSADLQPVQLDGSYQILWEYDARGNEIRQEFVSYSPENLNYVITIYTYDENDKVVARSYYDAAGQLVQSDSTVAQELLTYDSSSNLIRQERLDAGGLPFLHDLADYENIAEQTFDVYGNVISKKWIHRNADGMETCIGQEVYTYDEFGNCVQTDYLDGHGNLRNNSSGYARTVLEFSEMGYLTAEAFYDETGAPYFDGTASRYEYLKDAAGHILEARRYGTDGQPMAEAAGIPASSQYEYTATGSLKVTRHYNENRDPYGSGNDPVSVIGFFTDSMGYSSGEVYFDVQGNVLAYYAPYVYIEEVIAGSMAEAAGILPGDLVIQLGAWNCFNDDTDSSLHDFQTVLIESLHQEKELIVCRWPNDMETPQFYRTAFPEGMMGLQLISDNGDSLILEEVQGYFEKWLLTQN